MKFEMEDLIGKIEDTSAEVEDMFDVCSDLRDLEHDRVADKLSEDIDTVITSLGQIYDALSKIVENLPDPSMPAVVPETKEEKIQKMIFQEVREAARYGGIPSDLQIRTVARKITALDS